MTRIYHALLILFSLPLLVACTNPLAGDKKGTELGPNYHPGLPGSNTLQNFTLDIPFTAGTNSSYFISDATRVDLTGGVCRLKPAEQTDDNGTASSFGGATMTGVQWDSTNSYVRLNTTTNTAELDASWTPQWSSLVGYWKLDGAGSIANGAAITATVGSDATASNANGSGLAYTAGKVKQGLALDGTDDFATTTYLAPAGDKTMVYWVKYTNAANGDYQLVGTQEGGAYFYVGVDTLGRVYSYHGNNGGAFVNTTLQSGVWYQLGLVMNGGTASIYVNGVGIATSAYTASSTATLPFLIGRVDQGHRVGGEIDEVAVWNTALTAGQIQSIYTRQSAKYSGQFTSRVMDGLANGQSWTTLASTSTLPFYKELPGSSGSESSSDYSSQSANLMNGLVGLWHLNEPTGTSGAGSVVDGSGQGNNGTPSGSMTLGNKGIMGTAGEFSGGAVSVADAASLKPSSAITVSAWLNPRGISTWDSALMKSSNGSWIDGYGLSHYTTADNTVNFWINNYLTNYVRVTLSLHSWQHVVGTYDGSTLKIYLNGILSDSLAYSATINNAVTPLNIGTGSGVNGAPTYPWNGSIDEVALWARALSAAEVLELYRRGANRLKHQVRSCTASDCSDQDALSTKGWKGPDNTNQTYFSELYNTTSNILGGTVSTGSPTMTFANFSGSGLSVSTNRYFQYRTVLESDDANSLCNYGAGATACSPELKSVSIGPTHYDSTVQTITSKSSIGSAYQTLDANSFTETLGANSCSAGVRYALSPDGTTFYYWNGSAWATSSDYATASDGATVRSNLNTFPSAAGTGTLQIKTFLKSNGTSACEVDSLQLTGKKY